jgi:hypothetical protein
MSVFCSYAAGVLALPDLLTCLQSSVVTIIAINPSKSVEVHVPFGPSPAAVLYLTISYMVQVLEY